jgi:hypothetical protein
LVFGVCVAGIHLGLSQDRDSESIYANFPKILNLHYVRSRSWGVPLYEITAALLDAAGGIVLVNTVSLLYTMVFVASIFYLVRPDRNLRALLTFAAAVLNPFVLSNGSGPMETMLYLMLAMLSVVCAMRYLDSRSSLARLGIFLFMGLMVLARPDAAVFALALALSLLFELRRDRAALAVVALGTVLTGGVVLSIYLFLNHGFDFLFNSGVLQGGSFKRRLQIAMVSLVNMYGLLGSATILCVFVLAILRGRRGLLADDAVFGFLDRLAVVALGLYLIRFVSLPDQLEYFIIPFILSIILVGRNVRLLPAVALICLSIAANSVVHVALFNRVDGMLSFSPSVNWGGVVQDWQARFFNRVRHDDEFKTFVAKSVYGASGTLPQLHAETYMDGFTSDQGDLILGRGALYQMDNPQTSVEPRYQSANYKRIYVCDDDLAPDSGWRHMQPPTSLAAVQRFHSGQLLICNRVKG